MWVDLRRFRDDLMKLARCGINGGKWGLWGGRMELILYIDWGKWDWGVVVLVVWLANGLNVEVFECQSDFCISQNNTKQGRRTPPPPMGVFK